MDNKNSVLARYSTLIELRSHHDAVQFQWPSVVISAALVVISLVIPNQLSQLTNVNLWRGNISLAVGAGLPLLLTGLGIIAILYALGRIRRLLIALENEIVKIENELGGVDETFKALNHPKGFSGPKLMRLYMAICLVLPMTFFGLSFLLGLLWGVICWVFLILGWVLLEQYYRISEKRPMI